MQDIPGLLFAMASNPDFNTNKYRLIYFPAMGRGEAIRYLFAAADVAYEEENVTMAEWQGGKKKEFLFGSLPVLEVTDNAGTHTICQTLAILRYLAKRFGLAGRTVLEQAQADMVVDGFCELWQAIGPYFMSVMVNPDEDARKKAAKNFIADNFKPMLSKVQKILTSNKESDGKYFVGDRVTWADLYAAEWMGRVTRLMGANACDEHPHMKQLLQRIEAIPQIQHRIKSRQPTPL